MRSFDAIHSKDISPIRRIGLFLPVGLSAVALAGCGAYREFPSLAHPKEGSGSRSLQVRLRPELDDGDDVLAVGLNMECDKSGQKNQRVSVHVEDNSAEMTTYLCDSPQHDLITLAPGDPLYGKSSITIDVTDSMPHLRWAVSASETNSS